MNERYQYRRTEMERQARGRGGRAYIRPEYKQFTPKKGTNAIRILPPTWIDEGSPDPDGRPRTWGYNVRVHNALGPGNRGSCLCLAELNQRCPVCQEVSRLDRANEEEEAKRISARPRTLVWLIDRDDEKTGPQLWDMPYTLNDTLIKLCLEDDPGGAVIAPDDEHEGYDVMFDKTGTGLTTRYDAIRLSRRPNAITKRWHDYVKEHPIPTCITYSSATEIRELLQGGYDAEDEPPSRRDSNGSTTARERSYSEREVNPEETPPLRPAPRGYADEQAGYDEDVPPQPPGPSRAAPRRSLPEDEQQFPEDMRDRWGDDDAQRRPRPAPPSADTTGAARRAEALRQQYPRR